MHLKSTQSRELLSPVFLLGLELWSRLVLGRLVNLSSSKTLGPKCNEFLKAKSNDTYVIYKPKGYRWE